MQTTVTDVNGAQVPAVRFAARTVSRLASIVLLLAGGMLLAAGIVVLVMALSGEWAALVGFVVLAVLGVILVAGGCASLLASRHENALDLTAEHVVVALGGDRLAVAWSDITEIRAACIRYGIGPGPRPAQNWVLIAVRDPSTVPERGTRLGRFGASAAGDVAAAIADSRVSDPLLLLHGLRYYLRHAEARSELADGRGAERLRSGLV